MVDDDVTDGCLGTLFSILIEGIVLGTGYAILALFTRERGGLHEVLAYVVGLLVWAGLGFVAYLISS